MRLQHRIMLSTFAILVLIGLVGAAVMLQIQRREANARFEESARVLAEVLHDSLEHDMLEVDRGHIQDAVSRIVAGGGINEVVVFSNTARVFASGEPSEIGTSRDDENLARVLETGDIVTRTEEMYGREEFCIIIPVRNKPECHGCHGQKAAVLGAIEIGLARAPVVNQIRQQTLIMVLIGGLTFLSLGVALSLMLRSAVLDPLSKLAASARLIAEGNFRARAEVKRTDEVGTVAATFNEMASRIEQHAEALENANVQLERRVQERTEEVRKLAATRGRLLRRLISAQEEERRRIARELHDETGQALSAIMMELSRARDALPASAAGAREQVSRSRELASSTLKGLREMIKDLRPEVLDQLGLVPALRSMIKDRLEAQGVRAELSVSGLEERVPPQAETILFRVIQEALANTRRHADASSVSIHIERADSTVRATITDDGKGFDVAAALQSTESWGLRGMIERVSIVGGELTIESDHGAGTRIELRIPLEGVQGNG